MKKNYIFTTVLITISLLSIAQTPPAIQWQKSLGGSNYDDAYSIRPTSDGGYIVAGVSISNDGDVSGGDPASTDVWIVKLSSTGSIEWQKVFGGSDYDDAQSIIQTSDGGYTFAGYTQSYDGNVSGNHGSGDFWIVRLSSTGDIQWQKCLGGTGVDQPFSIEKTTDGGYIVAGFTTSNDGDVSGNHNSEIDIADCWIVKLNSSGAIQWQKCLGGSGFDVAGSVKQTSDGGYIIAGVTPSNDGDVSGNHGGDDCWIVKLDPNGLLQWQKYFGGSGSDNARSIQQTLDGSYIAAGQSDSNDGDVSGNHGLSDFWIIKLTESGTLQWQKCLGGSGSDAAISIQQTSDGGYVTTGTSASNDGDLTGNYGNSDYWIAKLDDNGGIQWQKNYGGVNNDGAASIEEASDHGYIIAGYSGSNDGDVTGNHGLDDYWIVKLLPDALLPVTLTNLSGEANGKENLLHWATATEQNNNGFEVQRSIDGNNFNKISFVNTKAVNGNSNLKLSYDFSDISFAATTNYYRLKQIDKDGKYTYSNIVLLRDQNPVANGAIQVFPNPVHNTLNVKIAATDNKNVRFSITTALGKEILNKSSFVSNGETVIQLDVSHLAAGTYFFKLISANGNEKTVKKFVKE